MQDLLSQLDPLLALGLIAIGIIALVAVVVLARRRRQGTPPPPPDPAPSMGGIVDYTTLQDDEPQTWRDRFNNLSLAGKILVALIPLLVILGLVVLILIAMPTNEPQAPPPPTPVPVTLTVTKADLVRVEPEQSVLIEVTTTGISDDTEVIAELLADGQPFAWLNAEQARSQIINNRAEIRANRAEGAPTPQEGVNYTMIVRTADGQTVGEAPFLVPSIYAENFFSGGVAAAPPTPTIAPTRTPEPTPDPNAAVVTPTPEPSPTPVLPTGSEASVSNGGNVRTLPQLADNVIAGVNAGETVQLLARTPNQAWYRVRTIRDEIGWVSASLLSVSPAVAAQVPTASVVSVFRSGAVYERPDVSSTQVDRVNAAAQIANSEVVELLRRTADNAWYEVLNARNVTGWVQAELLGIPPEIVQQVPVASE